MVSQYGLVAMSIQEEIKEAINNKLNNPSAFTEVKKSKELYVILINGKRIITNSGKSVWSGQGPAKTALKNHIRAVFYKFGFNLFDYIINNETDGTINYGAMNAIKKAAEDEWIDTHVVFVPYDKYMIAERKRKSK